MTAFFGVLCSNNFFISWHIGTIIIVLLSAILFEILSGSGMDFPLNLSCHAFVLPRRLIRLGKPKVCLFLQMQTQFFEIEINPALWKQTVISNLITIHLFIFGFHSVKSTGSQI